MFKKIKDKNRKLIKYTLYPSYSFPDDGVNSYDFHYCNGTDISSSLFYFCRKFVSDANKINCDSLVENNLNYFFNSKKELGKYEINSYNDIIDFYEENSNYDDIVLLSLSQKDIGNTIKRGSFVYENIHENEFYVDDSNGNLYSGSVGVGNIFYESGLILFYNTEKIYSGSMDYQFEYNTKNYIYELNCSCEINESEFNATNNPTNCDSETKEILNKDVAYMTTIGLYNDFNELIAVGKLSNPIKKDLDNKMIIRLKIDL